jgi:hypothetical protein
LIIIHYLLFIIDYLSFIIHYLFFIIHSLFIIRYYSLFIIIHYSLFIITVILNLIGETILTKGQLIGPAEVGILATVGVTSVQCYKKPIIGILSTGNELVDYCEIPVGSQIRDSNRATLLTAFRQDGYTCIDLGIAHVHMFSVFLITSSSASLCSSTCIFFFHASLLPTILQSKQLCTLNNRH